MLAAPVRSPRWREPRGRGDLIKGHQSCSQLCPLTTAAPTHPLPSWESMHLPTQTCLACLCMHACSQLCPPPPLQWGFSIPRTQTRLLLAHLRSSSLRPSLLLLRLTLLLPRRPSCAAPPPLALRRSLLPVHRELPCCSTQQGTFTHRGRLASSSPASL